MRFNLHVSTPKQELSRLSRLSWRRLSGSCSPVLLDGCRSGYAKAPSSSPLQWLLGMSIPRATTSEPRTKPWKASRFWEFWEPQAIHLDHLDHLAIHEQFGTFSTPCGDMRFGFHWGQPHTRHLTFPVLKRFSNFPRSFCVSVDENSAMHSGDKSNGVGTSSCGKLQLAKSLATREDPGGYFESTESSVMRNGLWAWLKDIQKLYQSELAKWVWIWYRFI